MTTRDDLIRRLCEASEGSAELSRQWWVAMGAVMPAISPCVTTDLSAAWEEAKRHGCLPCLDTKEDGVFGVYMWRADTLDIVADVEGKYEACTLCAAMLAAEGQR